MTDLLCWRPYYNYDSIEFVQKIYKETKINVFNTTDGQTGRPLRT
jgi:hypothetical protein